MWYADKLSYFQFGPPFRDDRFAQTRSTDILLQPPTFHWSGYRPITSDEEKLDTKDSTFGGGHIVFTYWWRPPVATEFTVEIPNII